MKILVTGGLGFIGSAVVRHLIKSTDHTVLNLDKRTYAATDGSVSAVVDSSRYHHMDVDIASSREVEQAFSVFTPDAVVNLAAETHVDRSIDGPGEFIHTNILGTYELLSASLNMARQRGTLDTFRFLHVSTDEVFGALGPDDGSFNEATPYDPRSPYSASKASSDHLVRAWHETYGLQTIITNCSNNYGPFHFPEKLIPLMILKAKKLEKLPVYGDGSNVRDWLYVVDHARAIVAALENGNDGESYLIGGNAERSNLEVVNAICDIVDSETSDLDSSSRRDLVHFVSDRPGHDFRYSIDASKARQELGWSPLMDFETGLAETVRWYLDNEWWWGPILNEQYSGLRLGNAVAS